MQQQRRPQRQRNTFASVKPRKRNRRPVNSLRAQNGAGVSSRDMVRAVRKFTIFDSLTINNANSEYAYGLKGFNVKGNGSPFSELLDDYGKVYEQYRIRRVIVRATPGRSFTNDLRLKTYVAARVDVDQQNTTALIDNLKSLINSENCVLKTMIERGNIKLCDYRPQCRNNVNASFPILPNNLNWFPITDYSSHTWKGAVIGAFLPEPDLPVMNLNITLTAEVDVEFRGRVSNPTLFSSQYINQTPIIPPDLSGTLPDLRNSFLTGAYFPMEGFENINVANIGTSVTAGEILDAKFRVQSTMKIYFVSDYKQTEQTFAAMEVQS